MLGLGSNSAKSILTASARWSVAFPNEPANVTHTARFVAELRGVPYEELDRTVTANFERVFGP